MDGLTLLAVFAVLPALVMSAGVAFALWDQDRRAAFIVQLEPGADLNEAVERHHQLYGVDVVHSWSANQLPGYRGIVTKRKVKDLVCDADVASVMRSDN